MSTPIRVSHSELTAKNVLDQYFGNIKHLDNIQPEWLNGLELDRYYPTMGIAIEFQGDQHSRVVPVMQKGPADFQRQLNADTEKRHLCEGRGIKLYAINLLDLDRFRVVEFVKKLAREGADYAKMNGYKGDAYKLSRVRFDEPDKTLMRKVDRLSYHRKDYYRETTKKKSWWKRLLGS